jgi:hypothetical protein
VTLTKFSYYMFLRCKLLCDCSYQLQVITISSPAFHKPLYLSLYVHTYIRLVIPLAKRSLVLPFGKSCPSRRSTGPLTPNPMTQHYERLPQNASSRMEYELPAPSGERAGMVLQAFGNDHGRRQLDHEAHNKYIQIPYPYTLPRPAL